MIYLSRKKKIAFQRKATPKGSGFLAFSRFWPKLNVTARCFVPRDALALLAVSQIRLDVRVIIHYYSETVTHVSVAISQKLLHQIAHGKLARTRGASGKHLLRALNYFFFSRASSSSGEITLAAK